MIPTPDHRMRSEPQLEEVVSRSFVLGHAARALRKYRYFVLVSLAAVLVAYGIVAGLVYLLAPGQKITTIPFRLEFEGAERGEYPNGLKFSSSEIVATPILMTAFDANGIERFVSFKDFSNAVFIIESNKALEQLNREYGAKLSDVKLNPVDRERLEKEYDLKRESQSRSEYSINFLATRVTGKVPSSLVQESLRDVLNEWARSAAQEKGALRYRLPTFTRKVLDRGILESRDPIIALDVLRTRAENLSRNIDLMLTVPGAEVLRTRKDQITLNEIRLKLADTIRFEIQPLVSQLRAANGSPDARTTLSYVESQLAYNELQLQSARARVAALRDSLNLYTAERDTTGSSAKPGNESSPTLGETVMPQIDESFLGRLISLSREADQIAFREKMVTRISEASMEAVPYERETEYYRRLRNELRGLTSGGSTIPSSVSRQLQDAFGDVSASVDQVAEIYDLLSRNLHPSTILFTLTSPPITRIERSVSLARLALVGILVFLLSIPIVIGVALLHNRVREEETIEDEFVFEARHRGEVADHQTEFSNR